MGNHRRRRGKDDDGSANASCVSEAWMGGGANANVELLKGTHAFIESWRERILYLLLLKGFFLFWTFYLVTSYFVKMSLLALYRRIFNTPGYRRIALVIMIISTMWIVGAMIGNFVICIPFDAFWDFGRLYQCLNFNIYALSVGIVEVVLDILTLALPVLVVCGLHVPTHKKVGLICIFLLGIA